MHGGFSRFQLQENTMHVTIILQGIIVTRWDVLSRYENFSQSQGSFIPVPDMSTIIYRQLVAMIRGHVRFVYKMTARTGSLRHQTHRAQLKQQSRTASCVSVLFCANKVYYHLFSEPNIYLAQSQMELCRTANIFAAR